MFIFFIFLIYKLQNTHKGISSARNLWKREREEKRVPSVRDRFGVVGKARETDEGLRRKNEGLLAWGKWRNIRSK